MKISFTNFNCKEKSKWDKANNAVAKRVWENHAATK
jgi:hypothetical protein